VFYRRLRHESAVNGVVPFSLLLSCAVQPLDEPLVLGILYQCAAGVRHLHSVLLVHRDIRADNFLVASRDPLRMLITDFGLSHKLTGAASTSASTSFTLIGPVGTQPAIMIAESACLELKYQMPP
jgi:serine/threonine protein kinase